jgi:two-component system sensor histidine kinase PilS (NtrC family)
MTSLPERIENETPGPGEPGFPQRRNLQGLLLFRLLMAIFFLILTLLVQSRDDADLLTSHLQPLYFFSCTLFAFTLFGALSLKHVRDLKRFAYLQLFFDVEAVTFLIFLSGGVDSLFSFLYMPVIISAALLLFRKGSLWIASICALSYGLLLDFQYFELIFPLQIITRTSRVLNSGAYLHSLLMNIAAFYLVAFLSGYLAESLQRSSEKIRQQKKDLHQLEKLHQNIVQSISSGLLTFDTTGRILFFNRSVQEILGLPPDRIAGRSLPEILPGLRTPSPPQNSARSNSHHHLGRMEMSYCRPSGEKLCLGYSISSLEETDGKPCGWIVIFQDLTQLKTLENHMRYMEQLAFAGRMAAEIAHEIKNPLAAMSGAVQMLQNELDGNLFRSRLLDIVHREINRINELATDFLWLSKGVQKPERRERVAVCNVVQEIIALLRAQGKAGSSHLIKYSHDCEPIVEMDPHQFRQILWNILENALEAMPEGGDLCVHVAFSGGSDGNAREVRIDIEDNGPGMPEDVRNRIFEPFMTTKDKGMGLGLSIVYQLVKNAGGRIEVFQAAKGGAIFSIFFPVPPSLPLAKTV